MRIINVLLVFTFVASLLLTGCSAPQKATRLLWPAPPEQPRIEMIGAYSSENSFAKDSGDRF
ncbi:MAG: 6-bladed beta-propeller, partial [Desulfuromonadales bacterium]|nr:6-bladed beta-propeller [Desulfuromonadales bacterium]